MATASNINLCSVFQKTSQPLATVMQSLLYQIWSSTSTLSLKVWVFENITYPNTLSSSSLSSFPLKTSPVSEHIKYSNPSDLCSRKINLPSHLYTKKKCPANRFHINPSFMCFIQQPSTTSNEHAMKRNKQVYPSATKIFNTVGLINGYLMSSCWGIRMD